MTESSTRALSFWLFRKTPFASVWGCLLATLAISAAFSWHYLPFVADDALITYRYSDRFLHGHGLTWNDGEFVEGYSTLLWVLLVAAGGLIQPNLLLVGWTIGLLANVATPMAVVWTFRGQSRTSLLPVVGGLLTLSLSACFAIWGVGGLETALFTALVAWALATCYQTPLAGPYWICPALLLGLLAITRPDGILFGISIPFALFLRDGWSRPAIRRALKLSSVPVAFLVAQIGFRLMYYGGLVPNTAYVKIAFTINRVLGGGVYVVWGALINCVPVTFVVIAILLLYRARQWQAIREALVYLVPGGVWLSYLTVVGGDIWPETRHWLPALACLAFALTSLLLNTLPSNLSRRTACFLVVAPLLHFALAIATVNISPSIAGGRLQISRQRLISFLTDTELNCMSIGELLSHTFWRQRPLLAVEMAGCLPFQTGFPSIDMLGLNDYHIARHRPPDMGKGGLGHELGDGRYVVLRKPDMIELAERDGEPLPLFRGDFEMITMPEFKCCYRLVHFGVGKAVWKLWVRVEGGRVGIVRGHDEIYIPGFLLASTPGARAEIDHSGNPVAALKSGDAEIKDVSLPVGTWEVSLVTESASGMQLAISPSTDSRQLRFGTLRIVSDGSTRSFRVFGGHGLIYAITARRMAEHGGYEQPIG